jgi:hypothetical protein
MVIYVHYLESNGKQVMYHDPCGSNDLSVVFDIRVHIICKEPGHSYIHTQKVSIGTFSRE